MRSPSAGDVERQNVCLEASGIVRSFGGIRAVDKVSFSLPVGRVVGLVGPNGAGKTTLINVLTGFDSASEGRITLGGNDITGLSTHQLARRGLVRTFQHARVFSSMTVMDSLEAAGNLIGGSYNVGGLAGLWSVRTKKRVVASSAERVLQELRLSDWRSTQATVLPYGIRKRLSLAMALMCAPTHLLLDEPAAGLNSGETSVLLEDVMALKAHGVGVLLVEHNMPFIMSVCDHLLVMDRGQLIGQGSPEKVAKDPAVIEAYLGRSRSD